MPQIDNHLKWCLKCQKSHSYSELKLGDCEGGFLSMLKNTPRVLAQGRFLTDPRRLVKEKPDLDLAQKHLEKSKYNYGVLQTLERLKIYDWALNVGFYAIYHCFLGILSKYGYNSKNQLCTITVLLKIIEDKKLNLDNYAEKELLKGYYVLE